MQGKLSSRYTLHGHRDARSANTACPGSALWQNLRSGSSVRWSNYRGPVWVAENGHNLSAYMLFAKLRLYQQTKFLWLFSKRLAVMALINWLLFVFFVLFISIRRKLKTFLFQSAYTDTGKQTDDCSEISSLGLPVWGRNTKRLLLLPFLLLHFSPCVILKTPSTNWITLLC